jgi:hypothetical protein
MDDIKKDKCLSFASTASWVEGMLFFMIGLSVGIPLIYENKNLLFPLMIMSISVIFCVIGYQLRKKSRIAGFLGLIFAGIKLVLGIIGFSVSINLLLTFLDAAIVILILIGWSRFL